MQTPSLGPRNCRLPREFGRKSRFSASRWVVIIVLAIRILLFYARNLVSGRRNLPRLFASPALGPIRSRGHPSVPALCFVGSIPIDRATPHNLDDLTTRRDRHGPPEHPDSSSRAIHVAEVFRPRRPSSSQGGVTPLGGPRDEIEGSRGEPSTRGDDVIEDPVAPRAGGPLPRPDGVWSECPHARRVRHDRSGRTLEGTLNTWLTSKIIPIPSFFSGARPGMLITRWNRILRRVGTIRGRGPIPRSPENRGNSTLPGPSATNILDQSVHHFKDICNR
jgi:hypothetical protein